TKIKIKTVIASRKIVAKLAALSEEIRIKTSEKISVRTKTKNAITKAVSRVKRNSLAMNSKSLSTKSKMANSKKTKRRRSVKWLNAENVVTSAVAFV
ncbi:hypothetical protein MGSAQ_002690, partial [marine sediment metagenome]